MLEPSSMLGCDVVTDKVLGVTNYVVYHKQALCGSVGLIRLSKNQCLLFATDIDASSI
ncbi:hypothetical protein [Nitrosomonas ureae]|nr:hypothetical protein [Nitrosomonas ureae]